MRPLTSLKYSLELQICSLIKFFTIPKYYHFGFLRGQISMGSESTLRVV